MTGRTTIGPKAQVTEEQRQLFLRYRPQREGCRPPQCNYCGASCWVELGPLAITTSTLCIGCGGRPRVRMDYSP